MYIPKTVTLELEEYNQLITELKILKQPQEGSALTEFEQQEATGILLTRALSNPGLFRQAIAAPIDLGKYKAIFVMKGGLGTTGTDPQLLIKFERNS